ncbi:nucleolar complex protein 14 [Ascosphaera acerosa]|nr:nucleolar complex protein 14 [Ascosphaera acerosa]
MPPSQLKQLKASLRESGVLGPQQSKKQKQKNIKSGAAAVTRQKKNAALVEIRERFNPFEYKAPNARGNKWDVVTRHPEEKTRHRPGVTKGLGEERRKDTLLKEMHSRRKVGALFDRRFGEDDPNMTPEQRAAERFARESMRKAKKEAMFNLEDDEEEELQLTHLGRGLDFGDEDGGDDFQERDLSAGSGSDDDGEDTVDKKRKRWKAELEALQAADGGDGEDGEDGEVGLPERKKSKHEVMKEVIAKSKFHKYERQKAKEDDDDLREILDKGLPEIFDILRADSANESKPELPKPEPAAAPTPAPANEMPLNPDRAALIEGKDRDAADREYDQRLKQLTFDKRSQPQDRTKSAEELAQEEAERLKRLEVERLRRMQGDEDESEGEADAKEGEHVEEEDGLLADGGMEDEELPDDAKAFGLQHTLASRPDLGAESEDDFIIDSDLVESDSEADLALDDSDLEGSGEELSEDDEDDTEFVGDLTLPPDLNVKSITVDAGAEQKAQSTANPNLAYTYPCPESHEHFLEITGDVALTDLPVVVQRIRALYHPRLHPSNKTKLARFAQILVQHVAHLANTAVTDSDGPSDRPPFAVLENLLRHIHSMAKTYPEAVASAFRDQLRAIAQSRPLALQPGDLVLLNGMATIFPTSDHFHPVVTPANLTMARYLGHSTIASLRDLVTGCYVASLCLQYQTFAKRYMPEFVNYVLNALCALAPVAPMKTGAGCLGTFFLREPQEGISLRLERGVTVKEMRKIAFWDVITAQASGKDAQTVKLALVSALISLLDHAADMWSAKSAFCDIFTQAKRVVRFVQKTTAAAATTLPTSLADQLQSTTDQLSRLLTQSDHARRPLLLHNHRPLPIKTAIPKFEENFNPDRHYDPDRERAELAKLKKEHKRERKGALRELRKDANFIARESLREKRERDEEYQRKYRRLIAEVQGEEGREANAYEREKRARKGKR